MEIQTKEANKTVKKGLERGKNAERGQEQKKRGIK